MDEQDIKGLSFDNELEGLSTEAPPDAPAFVSGTQASINREAYTLAVAKATPGDASAYTNEVSNLASQYSALADKVLQLNDRRQIAFEDQVSRIEAFTKLKNDPAVSPDVMQGALAASNKVLEEDLNSLAKYSAESRAVDRLMSLGATDPVQARVFAQTLETPDVASLYRDNAIKTMALQNLVSRWAEEKDKQSIVADVLDFGAIIAKEVLALPSALARTGLVNLTEEGALSRVLSTGNVIKNEVSALYSLSPDQFVDYVNSDLAKNLVDKNTDFGYTNLTAGLISAGRFLDYSDFDRKFDNVGALINLATVPGAGTALKLVRQGTLGLNLSLAGREAVRNAVTQAVVVTQQKGATAAAQVTGMTADEVLSAATAAVADTAKVNPSFSMAVHVDEFYNKLQEFAGKMALTKPTRLTPEEAQQAEISAIASVSQRINSEPVDIQIKEMPLITGGSVKKVVAVFGDGEATAEDALAHAKALGFDDAKAVLVGEEPSTDFTGVLETFHGTNISRSTPPVFKKKAPKEVNRYDDNIFGDGSIYLAEPWDLKWYDSSLRFAVKSVFKTKVSFQKAFILTPESIEKFKSLVGDLQGSVGDLKKSSKILQNKGYDGLIIRGFDKKASKYRIPYNPDLKLDSPEWKADLEASWEAGGRYANDLGVSRDIAESLQDQVVSFKPTAAIPEGAPLTPEQAVEMGKTVTSAVQDATGRWFAKIEIDIPETGFRTNTLQVPDYSLAGRWLGSARSLSDRNLADIAELGSAGAREIYGVFNEYIKPFQALTGKERFHVQEVMRRGMTKEEWYSDEQFLHLYEASYLGKKPRNPERALAAYKAFKDYNDFEWALRNDVMYENLAKEGYTNVGFSSNRITVTNQNAIVRSEWKKIVDSADDNYRIYDATNNVHYHKNNRLTAEKLDTYKEGDYVVVKTQYAQKLQDGTYVQHFLMKKSDLLEKPLGRVQVGYSAGGHRMYTDKWFVKQAVRHAQSDTGQSVLLAPHTYIAAPSKGAAQKWANVMDMAREAYRTEGTLVAVDRVFAAAGRKGYPSTEEFVHAITKGEIPINEKFEVVFDRGLPSAYSNAGVDPRSFMDTSELQNSSAGILKTQGRLFYSGKGEVLKDPMGKTAALVDPYEMMAISMRNVSRTVGMNEYRVQAIERWFNTFKDQLDFRRTSGASPYEAFMHAQVDSSVPAAERAQIEAQRDVIKRTLGFESDYDRAMNRFARQMFEWVAGDAEAGFRVNVGRKLYGAIADKSYTGSIRGLVFDAKLGMFNPTQFLLQMSTLMSATAIRPQNAKEAFLTYYPLRAILYKAKGQAVSNIDSIINEAVKTSNFKMMKFESAEEYRDFLKFAATSGRFRLSAEDTLVANYNSSAAYGSIGGAFQKFREAGRIFFNEGELVNQLFAYHLAWKEVREVAPNLLTNSPEFAAKVMGRTEDYSMRMLSNSKAAWQTNGLASLPTQFWAYPMRMFEASGLLGNARSGFTRAEQARLLITQAALFGIPGIPFVQTVTDLISSKTGEGPEMGKLSGFFGRGLIDNAIYALTEQDVNVGKRLAVGSFVDDLLAEAFGYSQFGDTAPIDLAGGASLSVLGNVGTTLYNIIKWQYALQGNEEGVNISDFDLHMNFFREISTVNNAMNGLYAMNYGRLMTRKGQELFDVDPASAAFIAMGFRPGQENKIKIDMAYLKNKKEHIESAAGVVHKLRQEWIDDPSKYEENMKKVNVFMAVQPLEWREEITRKAWGRLDRSTLQGLEDKVTRDIRNREGISEEEK